MAEVTFIYEGQKTLIQCNKNDKMKDICQKFSLKSNVQLNNIFFLYGGQNLDENLPFDEQAHNIDKQRNKMEIVVSNKQEDDLNESKYIISKDIICPQCSETCFIDIDDYKINLYGCKNGHKCKNIPLSEFDNSQKINISKISCYICKENNKGNVFNNRFYKCTCGIKLCPLCKEAHNKQVSEVKKSNKKQNNVIEHKYLDYDQINYICNKHGEPNISYCKKCKDNLCMLCQAESHRGHENELFSNIMPNYDEIEHQGQILKMKIDKVKKSIDDIIKMFNEVKQNIEKTYKIIENIIRNYEKTNRNYHIIKNINLIQNFDFLNDIDQIYNEKSLSNQLMYVLNIYNKIKSKNEIKIRYKALEDNEKIKIFDYEFVKKNKDFCKIIYNKKEYDLIDYFEFSKEINNDILEIQLTGINKITDMSSMFYGCYSLVSLPDISEWNTFKVKDMSKLFKSCSSLKYLPKELNLNTINVTNMEGMFSGCSSLQYIPDISTWNTSNVENMNEMFQGCTKLDSKLKFPDISKWNTSSITSLCRMFKSCFTLTELPNISNWNTKNLKDMKEMFYECKSLKSLPDISKWNTRNLSNIDCIFMKCKSLKSLPDLSKWDTSNVTSMDSVFSECPSLVQLPDISKWNTENVTEMDCLFSGCSRLTKLPDISKWNMSKVEKIGSMFSECKKLEELPDISNWDTSNIVFMGCLFNNCEKLKELPDISKWDVSKVNFMGCMFSGCSSLKSLPDISNWNTDKVTDMSCLFSGCTKLSKLPELRKWKVSSLKRKNSMFNGCESLPPEISKYNLNDDACYVF